MKPQTALIKLRLRLNKLHSSDYDDIPDWTAVEAINKEQVEFVRRQFHGNNVTQEGDEESRIRVEDLQILLIEKDLKGTSKPLFFESEKLPDNYFFFKRVIPLASKDDCKGRPMYSVLIEESNVPTYLSDWSMQPSFEWAQSFHTLVGNRLRVYTNNDFKIDKAVFMYYRKPQMMDIAGYTHEDGVVSTDKDIEFNEHIAEIILDGAVARIASDIESLNQTQLKKQEADSDN